MKKLLSGLLIAAFCTSTALALDKPWLERHLRATLGLDSRVEITIGESRPSSFAGLTEIPLTVAQGQYMIYVTPDEKNYFWGNVYDLTVDPDKERAKKISLKNVRSKGSPTAPVTIVEYTDLQCPYCTNAHEALSKNLYSTYSEDQVRWVFKHFPLGMHPWAEPAAIASECAGQQKASAFWDMTDRYYKNQREITPENIKAKSLEYIAELKLNKSKFETCLKSDAVAAKVEAEKAEGEAIGVSSTPSLFVNGRMKRGFRSFEDLKILIDEKLLEARKPTKK
jgi:protein-disulfide isomerase